MYQRQLLVAVVAVMALMGMTDTARAHPLGNFTTNVHLGLLVEPGEVEVTLVVDMAEIPAFREIRVIDTSGDGSTSPDENDAYAVASCESHRSEVALEESGRSLNLTSKGAQLDFPPGQGGLQTLRLECSYQATLTASEGNLAIENQVYADRLGWSEIIVRGESMTIETDLPGESVSAVLTNYPQGASSDTRQGGIGFAPGTGDSAPVSTNPIGADPTLVERIGQGVVGETGPLALLAALALGAGHALAPGHGKTLMAAYLVGQRGNPRMAVGLGLSVAVSHTIGVAILGVITALTTSAFQPETVYPWLSLGSAVIVTTIGTVMLYRAVRRREHSHDHHDHGHSHDHHDHGHSHEPHIHDHQPDHEHDPSDRKKPGGWRSLAALGLAGGLVPSASAVVLLLGAIAQGEPWWGLVLVAGFGLGMSASLIGAGLLAVGAQHWGWARIHSDRLRHTWERRIPLLGGLAVTLIGLILVWDTARRFFA